MKPRFKNMTTRPEISEAIKIAENLLMPGSNMLEEISKKNDFAFNSGEGMQVVMKILSSNVVAPVYTYRPKWRFSRAIGYSMNGEIHINIYKIESLNKSDLIGLLLHEWLHAGPGFSHGNNYRTRYKAEKSVNYFVSENINRWL